MKTAGDILSALFDERFIKKAQGYSKLFNSWTDITAKNGIAAAAAHSRIKDLDRGILLIEMDHPGWKQILQTKQSKLLNDFRIRFPELDISGISLILGMSEPQAEEKTETPENLNETPSAPAFEPINNTSDNMNSELSGYDAIKDEEFKKMLFNLEQKIVDREKNEKR
ncbi:MAG: DUF721 domain-containing protein [Treponema sp.]|nr:DUF721 domain-containing protein [Treponema sp.]